MTNAPGALDAADDRDHQRQAERVGGAATSITNYEYSLDSGATWIAVSPGAVSGAIPSLAEADAVIAYLQQLGTALK